MTGSPVRIIAADIGGTNCRFGIFQCDFSVLTTLEIDRLKNYLFMPESSFLTLIATAIYPSSELSDSESFFSALRTNLDIQPQAGDILALALAGPVETGPQPCTGCQHAQLTNGRLYLDSYQLSRLWANAPCLLMNDFTAQAYASLSPIGKNALLISENHPSYPCPEVQFCQDKLAPRGVLGAGTGLGAAALIHTAGRWQALPSEFGHTAFAFRGQQEQAFQEFLCYAKSTPYVSCEDVLSGQGLAYLHTFLTGQNLTPAEVGQTALSYESDTLRLYARFYARAVRHWILSILCQGGLWISGGIAQANPLCLTSSYFCDELYSSQQMAALVRTTPIWLLTDDASGLWGAAWASFTAHFSVH